MPITQEHRLIAVSTPLGDDELVIRRMTGHEQISQLFEYDLELYSEDLDINYEDLLGGNATVRVELESGETRYFNGYISRFSLVGQTDLHCTYQAKLKPWLWFLTRTADCRIFQEMTVPDIIKQVFRDHGFTDFKDELSESYRTWEYCVQYRETDFNFVSRLMEQEGIYYFFTHENGKHELIMADGYSSHQTTDGYEEVPYFPPENSRRRKQDHISSWVITKEVQTGAYALNDFDFKAPKKGLISAANDQKAHDGSNFEVYDYPGEYSENSDGEKYARTRIDELQAQYEIIEGDGDARGLSSGALFTLIDYPREDQNREYLLLSVDYEISSDALEGGSSDGEEVFHCRFSAIDAQQQYRAPRSTVKPIVQGLQTAIVVGASGEEIHTDEYGRIKVHFHWDRYGKADDTDSCWIRVAQMWAGKKWGSMYLPRVGQEVIVDFIEGDPDRPIVTGRVYNGDNMPPYDLPANKTKSTTKSNSSKGGQGFNEIRFEDKKGEEQIFIHAEKNKDTRIKNDDLEFIGNDKHLIIENDEFEHIKGDKHLTVDADQNEKIKGTVSRDIGSDLQEKIAMNYAVDSGMEVHIKAGMKVIIEAGTQISLKAGGSFVDIGPAGVSIKGAMVMINSGGAAGSGSGSSPDAAVLPEEADNDKPGEVAEVSATSIEKEAVTLSSTTVKSFSNPQAQTLANAAENGTPFCAKCEAAKLAQKA